MNQFLIFLLSFFKIEKFAEKDGKHVLTDEQRANVEKHFGKATLDLVDKELEALNKGAAASGDPAGTGKGNPPADGNGQVEALQAQIEGLNQQLATANTDKQKNAGEITALNKKIEQLQAALQVISQKAVADPPAGKVDPPKPKLNPRDDKHLYGVQLDMLKIDASRPYNQRAYAAIMQKYGMSIPAPMASSGDYRALREDLAQLYATTSVDYTALGSDLGNQYRIRMQDRIQSFLVELPSVEKLFPVQSGYQDQAVLVNMFMSDDFSQAGNTGSTFANVVSGSYNFEPEILQMRDVMFAQKFTNLKAIEKQWIGYLNKEGSDTMKWSFIEYLLIEAGKKLHNERELRRVKGKYVAPTTNVKGTALGACNGLYEFIKSKVANYQIKEFELGLPTTSNIDTYVYDMISAIPAEIRDSGMLVLYMPSIWLAHYNKKLETVYGANTNYIGDINWVKEYPAVKIEAVPNADMYGRFIATLRGNISLFEDVPGEMYNFSIEQEDWTLKVWSNWRESVWAFLVGKKFASAGEQDYDHQMIFVNDQHFSPTYYHPMTADDATPSVAQHNRLVSVANSAATAITNIDDATVGELVYVRCGSLTNAITIAKSDNFSIISAAWEPEAVGEEIVLMKRSDGKFIEIERINAVTTAIAFDADDATPSVSGGTVFVTNANTQATAITNLDNATAEVIYTIHGAGTTNASTIANSGNFVLTAAMTLAAGAWIRLIQSSSTGKFTEIDRQNAS